MVVHRLKKVFRLKVEDGYVLILLYIKYLLYLYKGIDKSFTQLTIPFNQ